MEKELTCIGCPMGCRLTAVLTEQGAFVSISGNTCKIGAQYGQAECTDPRRILTTTVLCDDGGLVSVKTDRAIPKDKLFEAMQMLNRVTVKLPVKMGDVLLENVFGSCIVATRCRG